MKTLISTKYATSAFLLLGATLSAPTAATDDERYEDYEPRYDRTYEGKRPFRVYVDTARRAPHALEQRGRASRKHDKRHTGPRSQEGSYRQQPYGNYNDITMQTLVRELPHSVVLVGSPREADMVVKVHETGFNLNFRIVDVDHKNKKYKKDRRYTGGRCGVHHKAFYTRVEEKGEATAFYNVRYDLKGFNARPDAFHVRASERFRYGKDLTASTNCGVHPTHNVPSNGVARLFEQASPAYKYQIAATIRQETAENLGNVLARNIRDKAKRFYARAEKHREYGEYGEYYENAYGHDRHERILRTFVARLLLE